MLKLQINYNQCCRLCCRTLMFRWLTMYASQNSSMQEWNYCMQWFMYQFCLMFKMGSSVHRNGCWPLIQLLESNIVVITTMLTRETTGSTLIITISFAFSYKFFISFLCFIYLLISGFTESCEKYTYELGRVSSNGWKPAYTWHHHPKIMYYI